MITIGCNTIPFLASIILLLNIDKEISYKKNNFFFLFYYITSYYEEF